MQGGNDQFLSPWMLLFTWRKFYFKSTLQLKLPRKCYPFKQLMHYKKGKINTLFTKGICCNLIYTNIPTPKLVVLDKIHAIQLNVNFR